MKIKSYIFALNILLSTTPTFAAAPVSADLNTALQKIVNDYLANYQDKEQFTGIAASVLIPTDKQLDAKDIHSFVAGTIGFLPNNQALTTTNLFEIGSITKSFTALMILQLQTEGKLALSDTLEKWLPQYPQWKKVTLTQLLNMTSGIPNYSADPVFLEKLYANLAYHWTNEELLKYAHPELPIERNEQQGFQYSNSNYILAALVIEKATQDSYENQLKKRILNAANNLPNTFYPAGPDGQKIKESINGRLVHGYYYDEQSKKNVDTFNDDLSWASAAGAIVSDTVDVVHWVQLLYHGLLIKPTYREDSLAALETVVSMKTGKPIITVTEEDPKGFGLGVGYAYDKESKQRFWFYEGSTLGFRVFYLWQPCNDVTTVVAVNSKASEGDTDSKMGDKIMEPSLAMYRTIINMYPSLRCEL